MLKTAGWFPLLILAVVSAPSYADDLETRLLAEDRDVLAARARLRGNPARGALVFHKSAAACAKCHADGDKRSPLGPDMATLGEDVTEHHVIEALLEPSKSIREGFETVTVITIEGKVLGGLVASETDTQLKLRDAENLDQEIVIEKEDIDELIEEKTSMMPNGLVAALRSEHEFLDLVRYVSEVARGGKQRADALRPSPEELVVKDDTRDLDHAGILRSLGDVDLKAGERIYSGHCVNCHGADGNTPKLATARAFGKQELKYGADPYKMFLTVSRGAGLMAPLSHLSPKERYQVVHYIRQTQMKGNNPAYNEINDSYLASLPKGTGTGEFVPTEERDFGAVLASQIGREVNNALTFRLAGNISVGYDLHRMRLAGAWRDGFLDLSATHHYRQRGEGMPQIDGQPLSGLGAWQWAFDGGFEINDDDKPPRGPVRGDWLEYHGHYLHGRRAVLSYAVHGRDILETIDADDPGDFVALRHTLHIAASDQPLMLSVAQLDPAGGPVGLLTEQGLNRTQQVSPASAAIAVTSGPLQRSRRRASFANQPRHVIGGQDAEEFDLGTPGRTVVIRFRTKESGTLVSSAPRQGEWKPDGKTLFVRGGRLVYDIGWVGAITGNSRVNDGKWHTAAVVVDDDETRLYVDGREEGQREEFRRDYVDNHVFKIGATATDFGGDLQGEIAWVRIFDDELSDDELEQFDSNQPPSDDAILAWETSARDAAGPPQTRPVPQDDRAYAAAAVLGDSRGLEWQIDDTGRIVLHIPPGEADRTFQVVRCAAGNMAAVDRFREYVSSVSQADELADPRELTRGGPARWPQVLRVEGKLGEPINGYALDTIPIPFDNPWQAWLRTSAVDFFDDGRAVVTTHGGDVYIVSGIDDELQRVEWRRFVAGLFEPFGVRVVDGKIYVTCRDGLKRLHDYDNNGEADFVEAFWIDDDLSSMFHAFNFDLQTDTDGNFYFAKSGQYTNHHRPGTIMRVPPEGRRADVVAWGIRTPNGMGRLPGDRFTVSDNQGPWMPAGKISLIRPGSFLGNMPINKEQDEWLRARHGGDLPETFDEPMVWTPQNLDSSCGGQVWVDDQRFGPLSGRMLHSSFGKGWLYYMSVQDVGDMTQASLVALPHQWDAGVMRLRVNPRDGQVYGTGLSGWQGPGGGKDGCLQRLRYTGDTARIIDNVEVAADGLTLTFNFDLDRESVGDPNSWSAEMWDYLWSRRYGSDQFSVRDKGRKGHDRLTIKSATLDGQQRVQLAIPDLAVCDQLKLEVRLKDAAGELFVEDLYMTVHAIPAR